MGRAQLYHEIGNARHHLAPAHGDTAAGMAAASQTFTVNGTPAIDDRVQLVYLSNLVYDYLVSTALSSGPSTVTFGFFWSAMESGEPL